MEQRDLSALKDIDYFNDDERDLIKEVFAKSFAKVIEDDNIRNFVKSEVTKQFDGDYDILFNKVKHRKFNGLTLAQHVILCFTNFQCPKID